MSYERTLIIFKPDAVRRRLIGRVFSRFEDAGLDLLACKVFNPASPELIAAHYKSTPEWLRGVGEKTLKSYRDLGKDIIRGFGTDEPEKIGLIVKNRLLTYMTSGPVVAAVLGGNLAIRKVRALVGYTIPAEAAAGTVRGDFSSDSPDLATAEGRSVENLIHASGAPDEAAEEIMLWFGEDCVL